MREFIVDIMRKTLENDKRVIFAYLFGSFAAGEDFRDIDIAVYTDDRGIKDPFGLTSDLKDIISKRINEGGDIRVIPDMLDIAILNNASLVFQMEVLTRGVLLIDKDYDERTTFIESASNRYRDYEQLKEEASLCS